MIDAPSLATAGGGASCLSGLGALTWEPSPTASDNERVFTFARIRVRGAPSPLRSPSETAPTSCHVRLRASPIDKRPGRHSPPGPPIHSRDRGTALTWAGA